MANSCYPYSKSKQRIFAAGCFWGVEKTFSEIKGVLETKVGYTGGKTINPTYEQVCYNNTGHAESVLINFDERLVSYDELLSVFWDCHDPTTLNRQGPDIGSQYRSSIFYLDNEQKEKAFNSKKKIAKKYTNSIVTQIVEAPEFYLAEEYHQKYIDKKNKI